MPLVLIFINWWLHSHRHQITHVDGCSLKVAAAPLDGPLIWLNAYTYNVCLHALWLPYGACTDRQPVIFLFIFNCNVIFFSGKLNLLHLKGFSSTSHQMSSLSSVHLFTAPTVGKFQSLPFWVFFFNFESSNFASVHTHFKTDHSQNHHRVRQSSSDCIILSILNPNIQSACKHTDWVI